MIESHYLFVFDDDSLYNMTCAVSFKDALWEMSKYTGESSEILRKSLRGYEEDDIDGIITLFNTLAYRSIREVYKIEKVVWREEKK